MAEDSLSPAPPGKPTVYNISYTERSVLPFSSMDHSLAVAKGLAQLTEAMSHAMAGPPKTDES